jgi:hypothetical protein
VELRQSTSQIIRFGPFLDSTDGVTPETALTITQADMQLSKDGAAFAQKSAAGNATHDVDGFYFTTLSTTDSGTTAILKLQVTVSGALPVFDNFDVVTASYYDAKYTGTFNNLGGVAQTGDSYLGATAQANLTAMYDTTGYVDDTAPASRSQVDNIGAASGGAFAIEVTEDNASSPIKGVSSVGTETGTFTNVEANDGVYHVINDVGNDIDWIYGFDVGGSRQGVSVDFRGFLNSNNDAMFLQAFDFVGVGWDTLRPLPGQNGSTDIPLIPSLLQKHTGTGADLGKVYLRFQADGVMTSPTLNTDLLHVLAVNIGQSVGYANGSIWVDTINGTAGVEPFTNGVADSPVLTWADALTLSTSLGITDFHVINGSTIQLTATSDNFSIFGDNWILDLNGQSISSAFFMGATVSGTGTGANRPVFDGCELGTCTLVPFVADNSGLNGTITFSSAGDYEITASHSSIAGPTTPIIDMGAAVGNVNLTMPSYSRGIEIRNLDATGTDNFSISGQGQIVYAASCSGTVEQSGDWKETNTGGVTINRDLSAENSVEIFADTANMQPKLGTPAADISADIAAIKAGVDAIPTTPMRGTDGANTVVPPSVAQFDARTLPSADYFIVGDYTAPDNAGITSNGNAIAALENISIAQIFAGGDVDTYSLEESLKLISAACLGIVSGAATSTMLFKAIDGSKTRLTATTDVDGNRSAVTKDATG